MDLRRAKSRKKLTDALGLLLEEKPLEAITIEEITDKAGVSRPTFYSNYSDRQSIIVEHVRERIAELFANFSVQASEQEVSPVVYLANFYNHIFESISIEDRVLRLALVGKAGDEALHEVKNAFFQLTKNGIGNNSQAGVNEQEGRFLSHFYSSALCGILEAMFNGELQYDKGTLSMLMAQYVHGGKQAHYSK